MRDLIGVGLSLFLGVIGIFFAYGVFGSSNTNSKIQETFLEIQQARTELAAYANQNGGYGTSAFTNAQIVALQLLPSTAISGGTATDQWQGAIALTGNFFADFANIDASSCAKLITKTPANAGVTGIAVAATIAGLAAATVNALPISAATGTAACAAATNAVRFVIQG